MKTKQSKLLKRVCQACREADGEFNKANFDQLWEFGIVICPKCFYHARDVNTQPPWDCKDTKK